MGLVTSPENPKKSATPRTNAVFPAPSSPEREITSPLLRVEAISFAIFSVSFVQRLVYLISQNPTINILPLIHPKVNTKLLKNEKKCCIM